MKKFLTTIILLLTMCSSALLPIATPAQAVSADTTQTNTTQATDIKAKSAIAADPKTGQILYAKNIDEQLPIASMTKMISLAVVLDQIKAGKLNWDDQITISDELSTLSVHPDLSNVPLVAGQSYSVRDLFDASIIASANACIMALADKIAGNQENFVNMMKEKLKSWGITQCHIITSTGLNNTYLTNWKYPNTSDDDENTMTAKDVAIVAMHIVNDYPEFLQVSKKATATFAGNYEMTNWNLMLPSLPVYTEGVDGLKTGTTDKAGACFAGTANRNNFRIITVVMNAENGQTDKTARFVQTKNLMEYVYNNFEQQTISKNKTIDTFKTIQVKDAKEITQPVVTQKETTIAVAKNSQPTFKEQKTTSLTAPVQKDTKAVTLEVENQLGYLTKPVTLNLVTKHSVEKANFFVRAGREIKSWFN